MIRRKSLKSILSFVNYNTFKNDQIANHETKKVVGLQNCSLGRDLLSEPNSNFQMFSNDILDEKIVPKAVTEKTVKNLNLNFKIF